MHTAQHSTAQHSTAQHSTAQHSTLSLISKFFALAALFVCGLLASCGGGGGSGGGSAGGGSTGSTYDLDTLGVPKFIGTNYLDITTVSGGVQPITRISKFRSSVGHSYADSLEACRSMKHYFSTPATSTNIVSPVAGKVKTIYVESQGTQIGIAPDAQPAFEIRIFHINPVKTFAVGEAVTAGQTLGTHYTTGTSSDVAVLVNTPAGIRAVSYFEALTDAAFAPFQTQGIATRTDLIHTKAQRDAAPLACSGETFTNAGSDSLVQWVSLVKPPVVPAGMPSSFVVNGATGSVDLSSYMQAGWSLVFVAADDPGAIVGSGSRTVQITGGVITLSVPSFYGGPYNIAMTLKFSNSAGNSANFVITAMNVLN